MTSIIIYTISEIYSFATDVQINKYPIQQFLKNSIFRAVVLCDSDSLKSEHFPQLLNKENSSFTKAHSTIKKSSDINSELIDIFDDEGKCKKIELIEEEIIKRLD